MFLPRLFFFFLTLNRVLHEEKDEMTKSMNMDALRHGMASGKTDTGRLYSECALMSAETPRVPQLQGISTDIPPALELLHEAGQEGYSSREEVVAAWLEEAGVPVRLRALAAHTEVYPERNAWYLEEILHVAGAIPMIGTGVADAYAVVIAQDNGRSYALDAAGVSLDEAIEALYQRVYDRLNGRQAGSPALC
jgi:hypothetical protein